MKAIITPKTEQGRTVIQNLRRLENIFNKPALRFTLKATLPKKYRRGVLGFKLLSDGDGVVFSMPENPTAKQSKKVILSHVETLVRECDGELSDVNVKIILN